MKSACRHLIIWLLLIHFAGAVQAQALGQPMDQPEVSAEAWLESGSLKAGDTGNLVVRITIPTGYHIYTAVKTTEFISEVTTVIKLNEGLEITGSVLEPKPHKHREELSPTDIFEYYYHEGVVDLFVPVTASQDVAPGEEIRGSLSYQICDDSGCFYPEPLSFALGESQGEAKVEKPAAKNMNPEVQVEAWLKEGSLKNGETGELVLRAEVPGGFHIYSAVKTSKDVPMITTTVELAGSLEAAGPIRETEAEFHSEQISEDYAFEYYSHEGVVEFRLPVKATENVTNGSDVVGSLLYQICDEESCFAPGPVSFALSTPQVSVDKTAAPADSPEPTEGNESFGLMVGNAILWGLATLLTPCVFPLIPVTLTFFAKQAEDNPAKIVGLSWTYALGIIVSFTGLGLALTAIFDEGGVQLLAQNGWVNLFIGAIFVAFAFSLFGAFELALPSGLVNKFGMAGKTGYGAAFFFGLVFAIVTFACTAPFVAVVLAAAVAGDWSWAFWGMFFYSLALASPFIVMGSIPRLKNAMPKPGGWMKAVKVTMGFVELALAFKFISGAAYAFNITALSYELVLSIWIACAFGTGLYLFGLLKLDGEEESIGATRMIIGLLFVSAGFWLTTGLYSNRDLPFVGALLPLREASATETGGHGEVAAHKEFDSFEPAWEEAQKTGKPLFVEFTGFT